MKNLNTKIILMRYLAIFFLLISCNAEKQLNKLQINHPDIVAKKTAEWYPCETQLYKIDSSSIAIWRKKVDSINLVIKNKKDTLIYAKDTFKIVNDCNAMASINKELLSKLNASYEFIDGLQEQLNHIPVVYRTDVVVDTAKLYYLNSQIDKYRNDYIDTNKKYIKSLWWIIVLFIILTSFVLYEKIKK